MPDLLGGIPFGVDDVRVSTRTAAGALAATKTDVFGATAISLNTDSDTEEARGDNVAARKQRTNKGASGSVGMLQHDPAILAAIGDGATSTSGTTPATIVKYLEPEKPGSKWYQIEAQSWDGASATRMTILSATTVSGPNFDWSTDGFSEPGWDFEAKGFLDSTIMALYKIEVFETGVALTGTNP